ncbi:hypothetical protein QFC21_005487 [Naganishia friedmannii]|uniref:Uncharacterized protein n=1 Tax=Naganishia friedmannii TaxID=89922 RepID=A0ACC2V974_9TREE|nr:hypothetical protein QFC21_005487 [Naganishia friedmannii]
MSREPCRSQGLGVNSYSHVDKLQDYRILSCIGQGSFGVIHKVERIRDKTVFAMKQLDYSKMSPKDRRQMLSEVNILDCLNHPNVVMLHDKIIDKDEQKIYIVMEYCGGGDLGKIILSHKRAGKAIAEVLIWQYFAQLVLALHHCHWPEDREKLAKESFTNQTPFESYAAADPALKRRTSATDGAGQVLHRDLKPENIFLNEKQDMLKLGDFGLSKNLGGQSFTQTYVGTPLYMPPEILQENRYDTKSDIWSLGCMIYELCNLQSPFANARSQPELITLVNSGRVPPMPTYLSTKLKDTPGRRPSTADLLKLPEIDFHRSVMDLTIRTGKISSFERRVKMQMEVATAKEREIIERERRLLEREKQQQERDKQLQERERALQQRTENSQAQMDDFQKIRNAFEVEKTIFGKQKTLWEREKGTFLQTKHAQQGTGPGSDERTGSRSSANSITSTSTSTGGKQRTSLNSSEERSVSRMLGGAENAFGLTRSPSLPSVETDISSKRSFIPTSSKALQERSLPNNSSTRSRRSSVYDADTPCKIPGSMNPADTSRMLVDSPASARMSLRAKAQTRSMGNLRERARLDLENMPPSPDSEDDVSPMDQGTPFAERLGGARASVSSPSEYRSRLEKANERKMAEARADLVPFKPPTRLRGSSTMPVPVSRLPTYIWKENMTPAKWTPDAVNDMPSPFLRPAPPQPTLTRARVGGGSDLRQMAFRNVQAANHDGGPGGGL